MENQHFNLSPKSKDKIFGGVPFIDQVIAYLDYLRNDARDSQVIKFLNQEEFEKNPEFLLEIVGHRPYFYPSMPWKFKVDILFVNAYLN